MPEHDIQKRVTEAYKERTFRHWYQKWWGRLLMVLLFVLGVLLVLFLFYVNFYYQRIASGEFLNLTVGAIEQEARLDLLHNGGDPAIGPASAPVTIVAFEDFECPYCFQAQPFLRRMLTKYEGDIRLIYKDFPLTVIHPNAQLAAEAAQCANEQGKFWEFHDELFANQGRLAEAYYRSVVTSLGMNINEYNECMASGRSKKLVTDDIQLGRSLGVVGTPTFFVNGELLAQGYSAELEVAFEEAIDYILGL